MKPFIFIHWVCFLIILITNTGCFNFVYKPIAIQPTVFKEKGDVQLSLNTSVIQTGQVAYAITDNIGFSLQTIFPSKTHDTMFGFNNNGVQNGTFINFKKNKGFDISACYYLPYDDGLVIELYGGYKLLAKNEIFKSLDSLNRLISTEKKSSLEYQQFYIMPVLAIKSNHLTYGLVPKLSMIAYDNSNTFDYLIEPNLYFSFGFKYIQLSTNLGFKIVNKNNPSVDYFPVTFAVGLVSRFNYYKVFPNFSN